MCTCPLKAARNTNPSFCASFQLQGKLSRTLSHISKAARQHISSLHGAKRFCRLVAPSGVTSASSPLRAHGYTPSLIPLSRFSPPPSPRRSMDTHLKLSAYPSMTSVCVANRVTYSMDTFLKLCYPSMRSVSAANRETYFMDTHLKLSAYPSMTSVCVTNRVTYSIDTRLKPVSYTHLTLPTRRTV